MAALAGRQNNLTFMGYTERLRKARAIIQASVNPRSHREWGPMLEDETFKAIENIIRDPAPWQDHINWCLHFLCPTTLYSNS